MELLSNGVCEIRKEELMVSPLGGNPSLRTAHFLKPTLKCMEDPARDLLPHALFSETTILRPERLNVRFRGWLNPHKEYKIWKERLHSKYEDIWRRAEIYEAIKASTYQIQRSDDLILGLAKKWYSETNTFIFSWGESTITLEDTMVLGGYSVVGSPVFTPLEDEESKEMEEKLNEVRRKLTKTKAKKASHLSWLKHFMEEKGELEHAAFLSLWLSMSVFPGGSISKQCFSIAMHLSRGTRIALAPAVLASIYRDLTLLKRNIDEAIMLETGKSEKIILRAPFELIQVWALERFPTLHPKPKETEFNQPRIAKWHKVKMLSLERVSVGLDSSGESFHWRPYTNSPKFYNENDRWVWFNSDSHQDLESFARCLMHAELVGVDEDCIEKYLPHRVAMQFGLDQDVPGWVPRCKEINGLIAWRNYNRPVTDTMLCLAAVALSSTLRPSVTSKYLEWWKQSKLRCEQKLRMDFDADVPPGFSPKCCRQSMVFGNSFGLRNDESDQIGIVPSPIAIDKTDVSVVDGIEILAKCENENVVGGSKRVKEDVKNNGIICKSKRIKETNNGAIEMKGKDISPCIEVISDYETRIGELERVVAKLKAARFCR